MEAERKNMKLTFEPIKIQMREGCISDGSSPFWIRYNRFVQKSPESPRPRPYNGASVFRKRSSYTFLLSFSAIRPIPRALPVQNSVMESPYRTRSGVLVSLVLFAALSMLFLPQNLLDRVGKRNGKSSSTIIIWIEWVRTCAFILTI
jgi:hypothetical protein